MDIPLISEYKVGFITRRIFQSLFGGLRLLLGFPVPPYIYLFQIVLYLLPWILSSILTFLVESKHLVALHASIIQGIIIVTLVLCLQMIARGISKSTVDTEKTNHLEEDDIVLFSGCCSLETLSFLFPAKRKLFVIIFHSAVAGVMNGLTLYYLLPTYQMTLWNKSYSISTVIYVFGWLSLCNAHFALCVNSPPEPATYRTINSQLWGPLHRPLYIIILLIAHFIIRENTCCHVLDANLYLLFAFLPALWMLGILPPVEALFHWAGEQVLINLAGASPVTSYLWLCFNLLLFIGQVALVHQMDNWTNAVILSSCFGWLLSTDLETFFRWLFTKCCVSVNPLNRWSFTLKDFLYYGISAFAALAASAAGLQMQQEKGNLGSRYVLGSFLIGIFCIIVVLRQLHSVYFVNLIRNPLFPVVDDGLEKLRNGKLLLKFIWIIRYITLRFASPIVMVLY